MSRREPSLAVLEALLRVQTAVARHMSAKCCQLDTTTRLRLAAFAAWTAEETGVG